jgi:hypothetical protein
LWEAQKAESAVDNMEFEKPDLATLESERDVEHKFLYPLLVGETPSGLGFDPSQVKTQKNL